MEGIKVLDLTIAGRARILINPGEKVRKRGVILKYTVEETNQPHYNITLHFGQVE